MGGSEIPYLYDGPTHRKVAYPYSDFNPKAVTQANYARLAQISTDSQTPKKEGPLINFNAHPDSYVVYSGDNKEYKPLPPKTKTAVKSTRWVQFGLRLLQEIVALGLLVATICIKSTSGYETYLLRIPQAWDSLIGLYAIYHLLRPAKGRTPASSASYHTFALVMDVALIPLYVYIALLVNNNRSLPLPQYSASGNELDGNWRWTSFFDQDGTNLLLLVTFIAAATIAGLHLLSCGLDLYLIIVFRKITALPPDMNPLEDNLTRRTSLKERKHKYKNSEVTLNSNGSMSEIDRKKLAHLSGSTLSVGDQSRLSGIGKQSFNDERNVPFGHSRTGSSTNLAFSPHNPESARWSRHQFHGQQNVYQEAMTNPRRSRYEVRPDGKLEVRSRRGSQSPSKRDSAVVTPTMTTAAAAAGNRNSFVHVDPEPASPASHQTYQTARADSPGRQTSPVPNFSRSGSPRAQVEAMEQEQKQQLLNDNWYVLDASDDDLGSPSRQRTPAPMIRGPPAKNGYLPIAHDRHDSFEPASNGIEARNMAMVPRPLGMHPPTPPMPEERYPDPADEQNNGGAGVDRSLTAASANTQSSSVYSESVPSLNTSKSAGTPKGKYYGDLAAATRGVRGQYSSPGQAGFSQPYGYGLPPSPQPSRTPSPEKKARVISRTGADIADEGVLYVPESKYGMRNRRDVSGKIAEEGRGGSWGRRG